MPAKNSIKQYLEDGYYHLYNRGVEKRIIFMDNQDYTVFLTYLKQYLLPKNVDDLRDQLANPSFDYADKDKILKQIKLNNFNGEITLLAYCLMPNHFHFLVHQKSSGSIDRFTNSILTRYTMYFNRRYKRVGKLYQGVYKAVLVKNDEQLLQVSGYIHKQALPSPQGVALQARQGDALQNSYNFPNRHEQPSSYYCYIGKEKCDWVNPKPVLNTFFQNNQQMSYQKYVEQSSVYFLPDKLIFEEE